MSHIATETYDVFVPHAKPLPMAVSVAVSIDDDAARIWARLPDQQQADLIFTVEPRKPFHHAGERGVREVLTVLEDYLEDTLDDAQIFFVTSVLPTLDHLSGR